MGKTIDLKHLLFAATTMIVMLLSLFAGSSLANASQTSGSDYGGGAVVPGGGEYTYPVQIRGADAKPGETAALPDVKAPNGSPVTITSEEGLPIQEGNKVTYPEAGYYHFAFQSADNSYTGVILVEVR